MANAADFLNSVYELLAKTFSVGTTPDLYLQMGWPGISLGPSDFKLTDGANDPYDPACAEETVSMLANIAPACSAVNFANSGYEIDDLYQILILGAMIQGGDPANMLANPAYKLFSDAQYELAQAQRGSLRDPNLFYLPCKATPVDWYREASAQYWPTLSLSSSEVKPASNSSPFMRLGGRQLIEKGLLQTLPAQREAPQLRTRLSTGLSARISRPPTLRSPVATAPAAGLRPLDLARSLTPTAAGPVARLPTRALSISDAEVGRRLKALVAEPAFKKGLHPTKVAARIGSLDRIPIDANKLDVLPARSVVLKDKLLVRELLNEQLTPTPVSAATSGFSISFKYCMVNLTRSWLKLALLNTKNWYLYGTAAGEYSNGQVENNPGMFPMISTSFIAIRDLVIKANWSQSDMTALKQAKFLGPFDIGGGTINQNTIEARGLQIIAWQSRLTPTLPPLSAPST